MSDTIIQPLNHEKMVKNAKSSYHHGNLKIELINGGLQLLEECGVNELSLRGLAKQVGVSRAAPYHHFEDKNALLAALAAEGFNRTGNILRTVSIKHHSLERRIFGLTNGFIRLAKDTPELFRLMYGSQIQNRNNYPELIKASTEAYESLSALIQDMILEFKIPNIDTKTTTATYLAFNHGLATFIVDKNSSPALADVLADDKTLIDQAVRLFVHGLAPA